MRKAFALAIIATILAVMAYLMKPSDEACIAKAREEFKVSKIPSVDAPIKINTQLLAETMEKSFLESLVVEDRFLYKDIYLVKGPKQKIGWGAFGFVNVDIK